jgi:hypothetical protein
LYSTEKKNKKKDGTGAAVFGFSLTPLSLCLSFFYERLLLLYNLCVESCGRDLESEEGGEKERERKAEEG